MASNEPKRMPFPASIAYIGLGSNLGRRRRNLKKAIQLLGAHPGLRILRTSPVYESSPVGPRQPSYLNAVAELETPLAPLPLLDLLKKTERALGRVPGPRWGPRLIDLDLLVYGGRKIEHPRLVVPHPELARRKFALWPLRDLAPALKIPGTQRTVRQLSRRLTDPDQRVKLLSKIL